MRMRGRTAATALAVAMALTLPATPLMACGPENPPPAPGQSQTTTATSTPTPLPDVLLDRSIRITLDAPSKRVAGSAAIGQFREEFDVTFAGNDAKGTKTSSAPGISTTTMFVRVGEDLFINADEHYWQAYFNLEVLQYLVHKWVRVAADNPNHADLVVLQSDESVKPVGTVTQTGTDTIDGTPVLVLEDDDGSRFFVAAEGEAYLLRFEGSQATEIGTATVVVTFSEFGTVSETIAPPTGEVFDPEHDFPSTAVGHD